MTRDDGTVMGGARRLGALLDRDEILELTPIELRPIRCSRKDMWGDQWDVMQAIWKDEK